jgi:pimeloyl-ACP methyl ester carboxylesterase
VTRKRILTALLALLGVYGLVCGVARATYRSILYPAPAWSPSAPDSRLLTVTTSDGRAAHALDYASPSDSAVVVWFHGNGETAESNVDLVSELRAWGAGSVFVEYRGYGASAASGPPTEQGLYADAAAVLDALDARGTHKEAVVLVGYSLGTGVATEMARRGRARAMVLLAPFTSIPAVASSMVPLLPMSLIVGDAFDTLSKAPALDVPITVIHGTADEVVPFWMGERVSKALPHATFVRVDGAHHTDLFSLGGEPVMQALRAVVAGRSAGGTIP